MALTSDSVLKFGIFANGISRLEFYFWMEYTSYYGARVDKTGHLCIPIQASDALSEARAKNVLWLWLRTLRYLTFSEWGMF